MTVLQTKLAALLKKTNIDSTIRSWANEATNRIEHGRDVYMDHAVRIDALEAQETDARLDALEARIAKLEEDPVPPPPPPPPPPVTGQTDVQLPATVDALRVESNKRYLGPSKIRTVSFDNGVTNVTLENLEITNGNTASGIRMTSCSNVTLHKVHIHHCTGGFFADGSAFVKADDVTLYDCVIEDIFLPSNGQVGIGMQTCGKRWKAYNCRIERCAQQGGLLDASTGKGASDFYFSKCRFLDNGHGYNGVKYAGGNHGCYAKAPNCVFEDCEISGNDKNGFSLRYPGAVVRRCFSKPHPNGQPIDIAWFGFATAPLGVITIEDNNLNGAQAASIYISAEGVRGQTFKINRNSITGGNTNTTGINAEIPVAEHVGNTFIEPIGTHERYPA